MMDVTSCRLFDLIYEFWFVQLVEIFWFIGSCFILYNLKFEIQCISLVEERKKDNGFLEDQKGMRKEAVPIVNEIGCVYKLCSRILQPISVITYYYLQMRSTGWINRVLYPCVMEVESSILVRSVTCEKILFRNPYGAMWDGRGELNLVDLKM